MAGTQRKNYVIIALPLRPEGFELPCAHRLDPMTMKLFVHLETKGGVFSVIGQRGVYFCVRIFIYLLQLKAVKSRIRYEITILKPLLAENGKGTAAFSYYNIIR